MILAKFLSAIAQVLLFGLLPFVTYTIMYKRMKGFFKYIGLIIPVKKTIHLSIVVAIIGIINGTVFALFCPEVRELMTMQGTVAGNLKSAGMSCNTIITLIIIAFIQTSLSEEILFRGFIAKRLIALLGYSAGNLIQAIVFALTHVLLLLGIAEPDYPFLVFVFFFSGTMGYLLGYVKEKVGNGSIIPGWIAHGLANSVSFYLVAFVI